MRNLRRRIDTHARGEAFEQRALDYLQAQGMRLLVRNYRCKAGEIDLIMADPGGELVFVEVRARHRPDWGGAAASVDQRKRARLIQAASYFLAQRAVDPPCRFDVVAFEAGRLHWHRGAFDA